MSFSNPRTKWVLTTGLVVLLGLNLSVHFSPTSGPEVAQLGATPEQLHGYDQIPGEIELASSAKRRTHRHEAARARAAAETATAASTTAAAGATAGTTAAGTAASAATGAGSTTTPKPGLGKKVMDSVKGAGKYAGGAGKLLLKATAVGTVLVAGKMAYDEYVKKDKNSSPAAMTGEISEEAAPEVAGATEAASSDTSAATPEEEANNEETKTVEEVAGADSKESETDEDTDERKAVGWFYEGSDGKAYKMVLNPDGSCERGKKPKCESCLIESLKDMNLSKKIEEIIPACEATQALLGKTEESKAEDNKDETETSKEDKDKEVFAAIEKECDKKSSDSDESYDERVLTCNIDKFIDRLKDSKVDYDKDAVVDFFENNIEEPLKNALTSYDYDAEMAYDSYDGTTSNYEKIEEFKERLAELAPKIRDLQSKIRSKYNYVREKVNALNVRIVAETARKVYDSDDRVRTLLDRNSGSYDPVRANLAIESANGNRRLLSAMVSSLNFSNKSGLMSAIENNRIDRTRGRNMYELAGRFGTGIYDNIDRLGRMSPTTVDYLLSDRLSGLDNLDYSSARSANYFDDYFRDIASGRIIDDGLGLSRMGLRSQMIRGNVFGNSGLGGGYLRSRQNTFNTGIGTGNIFNSGSMFNSGINNRFTGSIFNSPVYNPSFGNTSIYNPGYAAGLSPSLNLVNSGNRFVSPGMVNLPNGSVVSPQFSPMNTMGTGLRSRTMRGQ